jgi:hypothetical protein
MGIGTDIHHPDNVAYQNAFNLGLFNICPKDSLIRQGAAVSLFLRTGTNDQEKNIRHQIFH